MAWFFKKKELDKFLTSEEFKTLEKKNVEFSSAVDILKDKVARIETENRSLRAKMNIMIHKYPEEEEGKSAKEEEEKTEKNLKASIYLSPDGHPV